MPSTLTLAMMSNDVYSDSGRGAGGYQRLHGLPWLRARGDGFYGACYTNGTVGVIAFRGTVLKAVGEAIEDGWRADGAIATGKLPIDQIGDAFGFFSAARSHLAEQKCQRLVVTGHSLGGLLAQLVAGRVSSFPVVGVTFNAPGAKALKGAVKLDSPNERNVYNYRAAADPISMLGEHIGRAPITIKNGGAHSIEPLIDALAGSLEGSVQY